MSIFRPREITADPMNLKAEVGLFGTCGAPASTWRQDIFIPQLDKFNLPYFNPQVGPNEWTPDRAQREAEHLANDEVIAFSISKETHGYGSLAESGWAILSALLRGQKLGIYVEEDETMPEDAKRARKLFKTLARQSQREYPVFQFEESMEDLASWVIVTAKERISLRNSKIREIRNITLPTDAEMDDSVGIFGTSSSGEWKQKMKTRFESCGINYFDSFKENWTQEDGDREIEHKTKDRVILQVITKETESLGSLAESGILAFSAFVRGQAYGLYMEDHESTAKSDTNRTRTLVRAHIAELNKQFPGIIHLADSVEDLTHFAIGVVRK